LSILLNSATADLTIDRLLAALNTLCIGIVGIIFYCHAIKTSEVEFNRVGKASFLNFAILLGLSIIFLVFTKMKTSIKPPVILNNHLFVSDWFSGGHTWRFSAYLDYSTLVVAFTIGNLPYALIYAQRYNHRKIMQTMILVIAFFAVYLTNSRTGTLCIVLLVLLSFSVIYWKSYIELILVYIYKHKTTCAIVVIIVMTLLHRNIINIIANILDMRQGSFYTRLSIYRESITMMLNNSPIWGMGIKKMMGNYPYGSHSTYIGVFYRAGIVGGTIYISALVSIVVNIFRNKKNDELTLLISGTILDFLILAVTEDLDGEIWVFYLFCLLVSQYKKVAN
jgi:hypothetical protein